MKKTLLFVILFYSIGSYSQNAQDIIDNLKTELKSNPDAKKTAILHSDLAYYYSNISIDSSVFYGEKALNESKNLKDSTLIAQVCSDVGAVYFRKGDFELAKNLYLKAYEIRRRKNDLLGIAKVNANLGNIYRKTQNYKLALKAYFDSNDYFEKVGNQKNVNLTNANIATVFLDLKDYKKAQKYLFQSQIFQEKNNDDASLCTTYLAIGKAYLSMKDTLKALKFFEKSIKSSNKSGNKICLSYAMNNIGSIKSSQKKSKEAMEILSQSKKIKEEINLKDESILSLAIAREKFVNAEFLEAKNILLRLKLSYENNENLKDNLLVTYKLLNQTYAFLKMPDSVVYYSDKYEELQIYIIEQNQNKISTEFETKYQTAKKEKQLLQNKIEMENARNKLLSISALAILISLIGFLIYRQQKLKNKQQNQEFELKTAISQIETQNKLQDQRLTISRDLHDNIGAQLTFIISSVDNIKYAFDLQNSKLDDKLQKISSFTKDTIVELRDTIWAMNNNAISFYELRSRILNFIEKAKLAKENINFKFNIDENLNEIELTSIVGMNIYRTIQEAVNNAIKYANATEIEINTSQTDKILITIQDNGTGFDFENVQKGNGLLNMQKRIEDINGVCNIESNPNGTIIRIEVE